MSERIRAIYAAIEYIESHQHEDITVADMAAAAGYSLYHFIRIFNQTVHHTPYDYLMRRRLSEAARDLINSDARIIDISVDYQFNNHETFSRAFKRMFHIQPSQWRERGTLPHRELMPALTLDYLTHINQSDFLQPVMIQQDEIHLAGLMTQGKENISQVWETLKRILGEASLSKKPRQFYWVSSPPQTQGDISFYFIGTETNTLEMVLPPLVTQILPGGEYIRFIHPNEDENLRLTLDYLYHSWLPKSDYRVAHNLEIEHWGGEIDSDHTILIPIELIK